MKERTWKFILEGLPVWAMAVPAWELLMGIEAMGLRRDFLLLYFSAFFLTAMLLETLDRGKWTFRLLPVLPVAVMLISWDWDLLWNCLTAFVLLLGLLLLQRLPFRKWIMPVPLAVLLAFWFFREDMPVYVAGCLLLSLGAVIVDFIRGEQRNRWLVLFALTALIACSFPSNEEPMRWEGLRKAISGIGNFLETGWNNVTYFFEGLFSGDDAAYLGYSENGGLSGGLGGSDKEELHFDYAGRKQPVYLNGVMFATVGTDGFTDRVETELPVNAWFAMYLNGLSHAGVTRAEAACFSKVERGKITYEYIRTSDLLLPPTTFRVGHELKYGLEESEKKGFEYEFSFISTDNASRYFRQFCMDAAEPAKPVDYAEATRVARELYGLRLSDYLTYEEYKTCIAAYREMEQDPLYLDTSMVTDRIRELTEDLTKDCESDLDKARAIEKFLRQYKYDLSVDLRGRENFVESFLFEEQKGYCVHYASAMICMLRACGVPARCVQGFLYSPEDEGVIRGSNAHVWVEAYLSGVGWVRFEPTASEQNAQQYAWGIRLREAEEMLEIEDKKKEEEEEDTVPDIPTIPDIPERSAAKGSTSFWKVLATIGFYMMALVALAGLLIGGYLLIRRILYNRLSPEEKLKHDVQLLCKKMDERLPAGVRAESVFEYLPYVKDDTCRDELEGLFRAYYRVRFRGDPADEALVTGMQKMLRKIRKALPTKKELKAGWMPEEITQVVV